MFIANGKVSKCYDYGVKVSLVTINRSNFMVIGMTLSNNAYDGHALESTLEEDILPFVNSYCGSVTRAFSSN